MDLEIPIVSHPQSGGSSSSHGAFDPSCSICLEALTDHRERSTADLQCGHRFHLDCIGSAFNAKGAMQCPNCRKVEKGRWLFANGRTSTDFDLDAWVTEDFYDLSYSELPVGLHWCPFRGITQLASLIEEGESQLNSYHESLGNTTYGDHTSASSSSTHVCPYLAHHAYPHAMHTANSSSSAVSVPENGTFPRRPANLGGDPSSADMLGSHSFTRTDTQNHNWQQHSRPFSTLGNTGDQSASQFGPRLSRNDASSQQRIGSFLHPHPVLHGSGPRSGSNPMASLGPPVLGEPRGHTHTRGHGTNRIYQPPIPSSSRPSPPFSPMRRSRPRGFALVSSLATTSSAAEIGGFYGFASLTSSANRSHHDAESIARNFERFYGWNNREGLAALPWIPVEGESQWWSPFNPNQAPQSGGSFLQRPNAAAAERAGQSQQENGFQRLPLPPRMPPPSYM